MRKVKEIHKTFDDYKAELAWPEQWVRDLGLDESRRKNLVDVIEAYRPTVLVGTSGQADSFNEEVVRAMTAVAEQPVILPMSNPTAISEAKPARVLRWSDYRALVAVVRAAVQRARERPRRDLRALAPPARSASGHASRVTRHASCPVPPFPSHLP